MGFGYMELFSVLYIKRGVCSALPPQSRVATVAGLHLVLARVAPSHLPVELVFLVRRGLGGVGLGRGGMGEVRGSGRRGELRRFRTTTDGTLQPRVVPTFCTIALLMPIALSESEMQSQHQPTTTRRIIVGSHEPWCASAITMRV